MKFATFTYGTRTAAGLIAGKKIIDLGQAFFRWFKRPYRFDDLGAFLDADGPEKLAGCDPGTVVNDPRVSRALREVAFNAPIIRPPKIVCVGLNYRDHAQEQNLQPPEAPMLFSKAHNVVIGPGDPIVLPGALSEQIDYEAELAVVIAREGFEIPREAAADYIFGYTILNDVTARDLQKKDRQFFRGKSLSTFAPMGPVVVTPDELDANNLAVRLRLNGTVMQESNTRNLVFDVPFLIEYISRCFPLEAGDVISTGTPAGVGVFRNPPVFLKSGDTVEIEIDGIGLLANPVQ